MTHYKRDTATNQCVSILHADDDRVVARCVAALLSAKGQQIDTVVNGREAVASVVARPGNYDLLIVDDSMPDVTGLQCVTLLRKLRYPDKIIVFASPLPIEIETQFLALGLDRILHKSSDFTSLNDAIQELLNLPAAANE